MNFVIEKTSTTPYIRYKKGALTISGKSVPVEKKNFLNTLLDKEFYSYLNNSEYSINVNFNISMLNAASKKGMVTFFKTLEELNSGGKNVVVKWHYNKGDEDVIELGEILQSLFPIKIELIEI